MKEGLAKRPPWGSPEAVEIGLRVAVTPPDGPVEHQTFVYAGQWWRQDDKLLCRYEDRETASVVTLKVASGTLTLLRQGDIACRQTFCVGQTGQASYRTPYGAWPLVWRCHRLDVQLAAGAEKAVTREPSGLVLAVIRFSYDLELGGQTLGLYDVQVDIVAGKERGAADADRRLAQP